MSKLIDVFAVLAVAVVLLLPKASVDARPALAGEPVELDQISKLQDDAWRSPNDVAPSLALADSFLSFFRSDWAIATMGPFVAREQRGEAKPDARVHLMLVAAHAERLESDAAVAEAALVEQGCAVGEDTAERMITCPPGTLARARIIGDSMRALVDGHIDPEQEPQKAKDAVYKVLHPTRANFSEHAAPSTK